jgi:DNA-binding MarR family transcriptional regulator
MLGVSADELRLGHVLKLVQQRFVEQVSVALAPLQITPREWGTLVSLDDAAPLSQAEVAQRAAIDRTTMVGVVDDLEAKGLVERRPHASDRRKNALVLTDRGREVRARAAERVDEAERAFLATLGEDDARRLKRALHELLA